MLYPKFTKDEINDVITILERWDGDKISRDIDILFGRCFCDVEKYYEKYYIKVNDDFGLFELPEYTKINNREFYYILPTYGWVFFDVQSVNYLHAFNPRTREDRNFPELKYYRYTYLVAILKIHIECHGAG